MAKANPPASAANPAPEAKDKGGMVYVACKLPNGIVTKGIRGITGSRMHDTGKQPITSVIGKGSDHAVGVGDA